MKYRIKIEKIYRLGFEGQKRIHKNFIQLQPFFELFRYNKRFKAYRKRMNTKAGSEGTKRILKRDSHICVHLKCIGLGESSLRFSVFFCLFTSRLLFYR
jgi:hypothetical protein